MYLETHREDGKHVETLDMLVLGRRGGIIVTFIDDEIVELTYNATRRLPQSIHPAERQHLWQILIITRHAVARQ